MQILKQKQFDLFRCIAQDCPESCCKFWQIAADEAALARYKALADSDDRIRSVTDFEEGSFRQSNSICGFLDRDELCYLQKTYGTEMLCDTCRNYPRHTEEYENVREYSLSLSCPEAARMLLEDSEPFGLITEEDPEEEEFEDFDCLLYDRLLDARAYLFRVAQDRNLSFAKRLVKILRFGQELQRLLDEENLFELDELIRSMESMPEDELADAECTCFECSFEKRMFSVLFELEYLHGDWTETLDRTWDGLFATPDNEDRYQRFCRFIEKREDAGTQILLLFLYTYFCGAVYDGWILSKVLLSVWGVRYILAIAFAEDGSAESLIRASYRFAREIEHSDRNLDDLEVWYVRHAEDM